MILIVAYLFLFVLPKVLLDVLQFLHIKKALNSAPVILEQEEYTQSGLYSLANLKISLISLVADLVFFTFWVSYGFTTLWNLVDGFGLHLYVKYLIFFLIFIASMQILDLPFSIYRIFVIDKKYGFCKQNAAIFTIDFIKGLALTFVLGGLLGYVIMYIIDNVYAWWIIGFALIFALIVIINAIYPTLIAPIFNKFTPLENSDLKHRIEELLSNVGFKSNGIFVMDASRRDGRLNAYFGGLGKSKRVVLFDTTLDKISTEGLLAILGHELGHFKNNDIFSRIFLSGVLVFLFFALAAYMPDYVFQAANMPANSLSILCLMLLFFPIIRFYFSPIIGYVSRKAEYRADSFGSNLSSKKHLANALLRLINENKAFPTSHWLYIFFYYSHPPLVERLKALDYDFKNND